jgi:hypothetical protein
MPTPSQCPRARCSLRRPFYHRRSRQQRLPATHPAHSFPGAPTAYMNVTAQAATSGGVSLATWSLDTRPPTRSLLSMKMEHLVQWMGFSLKWLCPSLRYGKISAWSARMRTSRQQDEQHRHDRQLRLGRLGRHLHHSRRPTRYVCAATTLIIQCVLPACSQSSPTNHISSSLLREPCSHADLLGPRIQELLGVRKQCAYRMQT